ncbi:thiol-disulfide oxidoreductase DCC family protein [Aestuariivirga sp.]|uniref:thiol-disulfide oxidoreductase DCC family protein n=1 Tax=Aestuariivirga sp. TaxID=2650926 RepID=UPI0035938DC7
MTAKPQSPLTVYYDGDCPVCRREIGFYQGRTGQAVDYCNVAAGTCPAPDLTREDALKRFHVRMADGTLVSGARAFVELWSRTPGLRLIAPLFRNGPAIAVLDVVYAGFLKLRRIWR